MNNKLYYKNLTIEVKEVTPEMAKDILDNHNPYNRNRNATHVKALLRNMQQGTWRFNGDTIRFDKNNNLIDGQHRLAALIELGKPLPMLIVSGFDKETMRTIDQEIKSRNLSDLFKIDGVPNPVNVASIINRFFALKQNSASFMSTSRNEGSLAYADMRITRLATVDTKYCWYHQYEDFYNELVNYANRAYRKTELLKVAEVGGIYSYLYFVKRHSEAEIQGFFDRLCFVSSVDINVINYLRDILTKDKNSKNPMTSAIKSAYLTKAWNYYILKKNVKILSYNKTKEGKIEFL